MFTQHNNFLYILCLDLWTTAMHKSNKENMGSNLESQYHKFCHSTTISQVLSLPFPFWSWLINTNQLQIEVVCYKQFNSRDQKNYCKCLGNLYKGRPIETWLTHPIVTVLRVECLALWLNVVRKVQHQYITLPQVSKILTTEAELSYKPIHRNVM